MNSLPAMVASRKCVSAGAVPEGKPSRVRAGNSVAHAGKKRGGGFVPYQPKAAASPATDAASKSTPADRRRDAEASGVAAAPPSSAPGSSAPVTASAPPPEFNDSGADADEQSVQSEPARDSIEANSSDSTREGRARYRKAQRAHKKANRKRHKQAATMPEEAELAANTAVEMPPPIVLEPEWPPPEEGWGDATYLSNDDTMSLSSAQRVAYAIDSFAPIPPEHVRRHELLNYFSFQTNPVPAGQDFSVRAELAPSRLSPGLYTLGVAVAGREIGRSGRRNAVLTWVVDRSGSMRAEGRMEYLKRGLLRMVRELKPGDMVNIVTFDHRVCTPLKNFVVGRDDTAALTKAIHAIRPSGSTNLHAGLTQGYRLADAAYQPRYTNRVVVVTDALANRGVTDSRTMAMVTDFFDARRIRLSGVGVGREFNDALLDKLTEKGRGAYVFLGSEAEVDAVFGARFTSLIETTANDVHFRLHLPPSLRMAAFHGEEASTHKADVQAVHFFADTSQLLLADVESWQGGLRGQDEIMIEIEYQDPETGALLVEETAFNLGQISETAGNVRKGELVMHFIDGIERQARRGPPRQWEPRAAAWHDTDALHDCSQTREQLHQLAAEDRDPEVRRVLGLWDGYCARFDDSVSARDRPARKGDRWPAASR